MSGNTVILVHGFAGNPAAMWPIAMRLRRHGFVVDNWGYPSTRGNLAEHAAALVDEMKRVEGSAGESRVHLVGHSMGAILVTEAVRLYRPANMGRVVLLAPPLRGSNMADRMKPVLEKIAPIALELKYDAGRELKALPEGIEVGVIAARFDHLVKVGDTKGWGEKDHLVVNWTHTLPIKGEVGREVEKFLRDGKFRGRG